VALKSKLMLWFLRREISNQVKEKTVFGKFWTWVSGKKVVIGALISVLTEIVNNLPVILPVFVKDANEVTRIFGIALTVVGLAHKAYKYAYNEELKKISANLAVVDPANVQDVKK